VNIKISTNDPIVQEKFARITRFVVALHHELLLREPELAEVVKYASMIFEGGSPMDVFDAVNTSDERRSQAKLFVVPGHYYSPIAEPRELGAYVREKSETGPELPGIALDRDALVATWQSLLPFIETCPFPERQADGFHFYFKNDFFGFGDAHLLHALIRQRMPKRYIEIGSGFSSACAVDTIDRFLPGACEVTFVEPHPERLHEALGERVAHARVFAVPVQSVGLDVFAELEAGDILFIDSSHVFRTGSDVCFELFEVLPRLASGVLVHVHDIGWPFEYPGPWIIDENRSWNEAYALRTFLTNNDAWNIVFFNDYFAKFEGERIARTFPEFKDNLGASLWLERR
jgi:predicted O-methyltransferase YrrM